MKPFFTHIPDSPKEHGAEDYPLGVFVEGLIGFGLILAALATVYGIAFFVTHVRL